MYFQTFLTFLVLFHQLFPIFSPTIKPVAIILPITIQEVFQSIVACLKWYFFLKSGEDFIPYSLNRVAQKREIK